MNNKANVLKGIQSFAIIYIVIHHFSLYKFYKPLWFVLGQGQFFVIGLFMLSGYFIGLRYNDKETINWKVFFLRRIVKIYPSFIMSMIVTYLLISLSQRSWYTFPKLEFLGNLLCLQDLSNKFDGFNINAFMGNAPLWFVSYVFWFYILFYVVNKIKLVSTNAVILISVLSSLGFYFYQNVIFHIFSYLIIWWLGYLFAVKEKGINNNKDILKSISAIHLIIGIFSLGFISERIGFNISVYPIIEIRHFIYAIIIVLLIYVFGLKKISLDGFKFFRKFSKYSYGIFLFHFPVFIAANPIKTGNLFLNTIIIFPVFLILVYFLDYRLNKFLQRIIF